MLSMDAVVTCFSIACQLNGVSFDKSQVLHQFSASGTTLTNTELQQASLSLGLKCKVKAYSRQFHQHEMPLPAILKTKKGDVCLVVKSELYEECQKRYLVQYPNEEQPRILTSQELDDVIPVEIIFIQLGAKEAIARKFDIRI